MQNELEAAGYEDIHLLGVNEVGHEGAVALMSESGDIPLLQDTILVDAWGLWNVTYRDVIIRDKNGDVVATFNLTGQSLGLSENYDALKALLIGALSG